jgi:hypothetical protein
MRKIVAVSVEETAPDARAVLERLSIPADVIPGERTAALIEQALSLFRSLSRPAGVFLPIPPRRFAVIYRGNERNEPTTPLEEIFPRSAGLALFAATIGPEVSARITGLFGARDFATASVLDAVASEATELAADVVQTTYRDALAGQGKADSSTKLLRYSPGYCGWHISGQRALFDALEPGDIGITLRESFLMEPLKSVSGVIVAGPGSIHDFEDGYPFCA